MYVTYLAYFILQVLKFIATFLIRKKPPPQQQQQLYTIDFELGQKLLFFIFFACDSFITSTAVDIPILKQHYMQGYSLQE